MEKARALVITTLLLAGTSANAQTAGDIFSQIVERTNKANGLANIQSNPFGETIHPTDGSFDFDQADLVLEGTGPAIVISRNWSSNQRKMVGAWMTLPFSNWELSLPRIELSNATDPTDGYVYDWSDSSVIFRRSPNNSLQPSTVAGGSPSYPYTTLTNWAVGKLPGSSGFFALAPDGRKFWFNRKHENYGNSFVGDVGRYLATRIEDIHGNSLTFNYSVTTGGGTRISSIVASDGRTVNFAWGSNGISSMTSNPGSASQRTWTYQYSTFNTAVSPLVLLSKVNLPDGSSWSFDLSQFESVCMPAYIDMPEGNMCMDYNGGGWKDRTGMITHPAGLQATYIARGGVLGAKVSPSEPVGIPAFDLAGRVPILAFSVRSKSYVGANISYTWSYRYGDWCPSGLSVDNPSRFSTTNPNGKTDVLLVNNEWKGAHYGRTESSMIDAHCSSGNIAAAKKTDYRWAKPSEPSPWPVPWGETDAPALGTYQKGYLFPLREETTTINGSVFKKTNQSFDSSGRAISVMSNSSGI